jgi:Na+-transporting NADH:ubiquinone oxidoreductase subunit A
MGLHTLKKGLDLPLSGTPEATVDTAATPTEVALCADDYIGMKPTFLVQEGAEVKRGQALFEDKKRPGVIHTSPAAGSVAHINRGARRAFQSVVITLSDDERSAAPSDAVHASFKAYTGGNLNADATRALLIESGLWTALRTRPYSRTPEIDSTPHSIFVTAIDTNPLAPSMDAVVEGRQEDLDAGLKAVAKLTDGPVYFCKASDSALEPGKDTGTKVESFAGPHPSGLAGTHIHLLDPVHREKTVWTVGLQDLLSMGSLFRTGKLDVSRLVSLAGSGVKNARLLRTRLGASLTSLTEGELAEGEQRVISGSILSGRAVTGEAHAFLGRYANQISALPEERERKFLGWMSPGANTFSISNLFVSRLSAGKKFALGTCANGSPRAMVPIGQYEKVMPLDILPTFLLRSLAMGDLERAEQLGCLELDEEDLALCTLVCPGKTEWGPILRENLTTIEKEG